MVKIFNGKYISDFDDVTHLYSYEPMEVPLETVRYLDLDFNYALYACTSSSKVPRGMTRYGMPGRYRTYWRKIDKWDKIIKKEEQVGS